MPKYALETKYGVGDEVFYLTGDFGKEEPCGCKPRLLINGVPYECQRCHGSGTIARYVYKVATGTIHEISIHGKLSGPGEFGGPQVVLFVFEAKYWVQGSGLDVVREFYQEHLFKTVEEAEADAKQKTAESSDAAVFNERWVAALESE